MYVLLLCGSTCYVLYFSQFLYGNHVRSCITMIEIAFSAGVHAKISKTPSSPVLLSGAGYHLTMVKTPHCDIQEVMQLVMRLVPEARAESHISDELSIHLPTEASSSFELLFNEIEERKAELGIASYGACMTSMEEVFLK